MIDLFVSPLDYIYSLGYNGINRVDKLLDISEFDEVILWLFHVERKEFQKLIHI